ncbi:uncharacterized protein LOC6533924 isoform X2 [Drosophila yakuba]|uniref:Uncharacterized protein, isoform A n=1 Tax=Drosophila yakuba TaxID=7245 RepID=B4PGU7_DROYA|nr:uncharacterized protein LOC6533924 isoform X2 [Drosophila yakuba]EDW94336.2 uncharacterized protein Dyak_GE20098, isoform A [Drosophila yakuba]
MYGGFQRNHHSCCCQKMHPCVTERKKAMLGKGYKLGGTVLQEGIQKSGQEAQRTTKIGVTFPSKFSKPKGQEDPCKDNSTRNLLTGKTLLTKVGSMSKSLASQGIQNPKSKPNLEQDQKALAKIKPKRRRGKKTPKRSTAGNIEQPFDDDGICMKNLFGSQLFSGNSNYQILKTLVPEGRLQKDSKLERPLSFSMRPALPPPDLQSINSSSKALTFTKKKGFRRGRKPFPCETSTQTIEEDCDPVLCCLEQIRNQLASKTPENQEKNLPRCFAEKSTNVGSIQNERNEAGVETFEQSSPNEAIEPGKDDKSENLKPSDPQQATSLGSFKKNSPRSSLNTLQQPKSRINNLENKGTSPITLPKSSLESSEAQKESEEKEETNLTPEEGDLKIPNDEETAFVNVPKPILKPCICLCRLPRVFPKCTRVMMPSSVCQPHFMNGCRMTRWQNQRQPNQHCCQCINTQGNQNQIPSITASLKDDIPYEQVASEICNHSNSKSCLDHCENPITTGQRSIMKRESVEPNQRLGERTLNKNICFRECVSTYSQSTENQLPANECPQYHCNESYASSRTDIDCDNVDRSSNCDFRSSNSVKSSDQTSVVSGSNSSYTVPSINPSERASLSEASKSEIPKDSSSKINSNISSNESLSSSRKTSRTSSLRSNSKTNKSSAPNEVSRFGNKNQVLPHNQTENKRNRRLGKRISSGVETFAEDSIDCGHDEFSEKAEAQTPNNSFSEAVRACQKCSDHLISERKRKASSHKSQEQKADSSKESISSRSSGQRNNFESFPNGTVVPKQTIDQSCNRNRGVSFKQRSQSAPECWILQFPKRNPTNRSEKSHLNSPANCRESQRCPENVLVLQDETCESDSDDYELVRCNHLSTENETSNENCGACKTPDYSINASILNELKKEESSISPTQSQRTFILVDSQHPNDLNISQQDQEREKPPMVQVPFRMSSTEDLGILQPKNWRELGLKFTMLHANQFQMAPATTNHVALPTRIPKMDENQNSNFPVGQMNDVFVPASSPPTRTNTAEQSIERRSRNLHQPGTSDSFSSVYPSSRRKISSENRSNDPRKISNAEIRVVQKNDSNNSNSERFISVSNQHSEQLNVYNENQFRQDESGNCYRKSDYRSDQSQLYNHQFETGLHNSEAGVSGYSEIHSIPTVLTWTNPAQNSQLAASNKSNATERSTDVETLETVTLMQPRKLRSCESAGIRNQANINENIVLIETRTPCNRENLLQTCGRPPCNSCPHHYTGLPPSHRQGFMQPPDHLLEPQISMSAPQNVTPFDEGYLIDPRDQWMTTKSPASAPAVQHPYQMKEPYQPKPRSHHQFQEPVHPPQSSFQPTNPGHYPQLTENIRMLPDGFYDRTVNKYNIARMDSNFQPPQFPLEPQFLHGEQHPAFRQPACPYGNQCHPQLMMASFPDPNRRYVPPQNQYPAEMENQLSMFWTQQNVNLDYYDQSEYQT